MTENWERERGYAEARNEFYEIGQHLLDAGASLHDFMTALAGDMSLPEVRRTWPVRRALPGTGAAAAHPQSFDALARTLWAEAKAQAPAG